MELAISIVSLVFAVIAWVLSTVQANEARKVLAEVQRAIMNWQQELNRAAIDLISSKPEVMAKQAMLEESRMLGEHFKEIDGMVKRLSEMIPSTHTAEIHSKTIEQLLAHTKDILGTKAALMNDAVTKMHR